MNSLNIKFANQDNILLSGKLELPMVGQPHAYAIFAHCFTCSKNLNAVTNITRALTQNNIAVLRFDFTGLGQSKGAFEDSTFSSNVGDLISAYKYLEENYEAPQIIIGHSLGGTAVLHTSGQLPAVKAVVTLGAPFDPPHVAHLLSESIEEIREKGVATVNIGGRPFKIKKKFLDDLENRDSRSIIRNLDRALLILHSPQDQIVDISNAAQIYDSAKHPKSFISLDGADHLLSRAGDSLYVGDVIASWSKRYVEIKTGDELSTNQQAVSKTGEKGYTTEVVVGQHKVIADEPLTVGGNDLGPSPYGYLMASLGSCTSMTLRMYADRKKWDVKDIKVHLNHSKVHKDDCEDCENKNEKIDQIERIIELEGNLDEAQRKRMLEIADKCPVHKTLHQGVRVVSRLKE